MMTMSQKGLQRVKVMKRRHPRSNSPGYAEETVELSYQLDGTLRVYRGICC